MKNKLKLVHIAAIVAVGGFICATPFDIQATPPSGISFTPVGRATLPEFSVKRKDKAIDWRVALDADQPIDVATQVVTFQPGGYSGWHTHPGPVFFTVRTGTLTVYEGDDPSCTPLTFPAGTGAVEAGTGTHIHMVRNETGTIAEALVTYLVPVGTPQNQLRTDRRIQETVRFELPTRLHPGLFIAAWIRTRRVRRSITAPCAGTVRSEVWVMENLLPTPKGTRPQPRQIGGCRCRGSVVIAKRKKEGEDYEKQAAFARRGRARDSDPGTRRNPSH